MSIIIEITDTTVSTRSGTSARTNKPYTINEQTAYVHKKGQVYPEKISINLEQNQPPYSAGKYTLDDRSFYVDRYGSIAVRPVLVFLPNENKKAV